MYNVYHWELENAYGDMMTLSYPTGGVRRITGVYFPPIAQASQATPTEHGSENIGFRLQDREVILALAIGSSWAAYGGDCLAHQRRVGPYTIFSPLAGPVLLRATMPNMVTLREQRRMDYGGGMEGDSDTRWSHVETFPIRLVGRDPAWYDPDEHEIESVYSDFLHGVYGSTLTLDDTDGLVTEGDWYAYPTIEILGPCTYFEMESVTTGQLLRFTGSIAGGETVTIVTNPKVKTATSDVNGDVRNYIPPGDDFGGFCLWPHPAATDGENEWAIEVTGIDANSTFTFTWEDRYQGL